MFGSGMERYLIEDKEKWKDWSDKMPTLKFDSEWEVKIIPPFAGALARFVVKHNEKQVSVYFDAYSNLGWMYDENDNPIPYFEAYAFKHGDGCPVRFLLNETDKMMDYIRKILNNEK